MKANIDICENHLTDLYDAVEKGDLNKVIEVEHRLTPTEQCVACTYVLRSNGTVQAALESFLQGKGYDIHGKQMASIWHNIIYWLIRFFVFISIFGFVLISQGYIKQYFFKIKQIHLFIFNPLELVLYFVIALFIFIKLDEMFLD